MIFHPDNDIYLPQKVALVLVMVLQVGQLEVCRLSFCLLFLFLLLLFRSDDRNTEDASVSVWKRRPTGPMIKSRTSPVTPMPTP